MLLNRHFIKWFKSTEELTWDQLDSRVNLELFVLQFTITTPAWAKALAEVQALHTAAAQSLLRALSPKALLFYILFPWNNHLSFTVCYHM